MESQIAELTAQVAALQSSAGVTNTGFAEVFLFVDPTNDHNSCWIFSV